MCSNTDLGPFDQPTIDDSFTCRNNHYWSATPFDAEKVWLVDFTGGQTYNIAATFNAAYVRCRR